MIKALSPLDDHSECGVTTTMRMIGSKWTVLILHALCAGTKRFKELEREVKGISPRTLSLRLKDLEQDGIVHKRVFAEIPLHVEYSLTVKGKGLKTIIALMEQWGKSQ